MPRRRSLTLRDIATAALTVIERDGLDAMSMRSVAKELRTGAMSLYRYVDDRRRLEELVVAEVLEAVDPSLPTEGTWLDRAFVLVVRARAAIEARPAVVPLVLTRSLPAPGVIRWSEALLAVLADAGFSDADRLTAFRTILAFLLGSLQYDHYGLLSGAEGSPVAGLDQVMFPLLAEAAGASSTASADDQFRSGLRVVLQGLDQKRSG